MPTITELELRLIIYILCICGGFILLLGGLWLVSKKKILVDTQSGAVIDMEIPLLGKLKTNIPGVVFFLLGFGLVAFPVYRIDQLSPIFHIKGEADAGTGQIHVYIALQPELIEKEKKDFLVSAPSSDQFERYEVLYISGKELLAHHVIPVKRPGKTATVPDKVAIGKKRGAVEELGIQ